MKCFCCKKNVVAPYYYNDNENFPLCDVCAKKIIQQNILDGLSLWNYTIAHFYEFYNNSRKYISNLVHDFCTSSNIRDNAIYIRDEIKTQIKAHMQYYTRDNLIAVCTLIKQICRIGMDTAESEKNFWFYSEKYNVICMLIQYSYKIVNYEGGMLCDTEESGKFDLTSAIVLLHFLLVLEQNIEICDIKGYNNTTIEELIYSPIEFESMNNHFKEYIASSQIDKPEDYTFTNQALKVKLQSEHKDISSIIVKTDNIIDPIFGFKLKNALEVARKLLYDTILNDSSPIYYIGTVTELKEKYKLSVECEIIEKILDTFTIRESPKDLSSTQTRGFYELRSIFRFGDQVLIAPYDFLQSAAAFRSYAISGHNIELYLPNNKNINLSSILNYTSTFIVYTLVDVLLSHNYILPMESKRINGESYVIPMAEIKKVMKNGTNLLKQDQDLTDIDILACDTKKKIIYNIEVKHYKPAFNVKDMLYGDKDKVDRKETVRKTLARESLILKEQGTFLELLNLPEEKYEVKSFIVSSRPNYYSQLCKRVAFITWRQFCERVENHDL